MNPFDKVKVFRLLREFDRRGGVLGQKPPGLEKCPSCKGRYKRRFGRCRTCYRGWVPAK